MRRAFQASPTILVVTPEITYLPEGMGNMANTLHAKAGGLADVSASLVGALYRQGADVHVALPHYRKMFHVDVGKLISDELRVYMSHLHNSRIHLAEDRIFYYRDSVYSSYSQDSFLQAMAFQREVINNIIPDVKPDLIHCNDWMTGLIPAAARRMGIPCLFTVHNIHTYKATLAQIEDRGIDAAPFWQNLYYERPPYNYEESRSNNPVDMLASGIFAAHFINTVSPTFLKEVVEGRHSFVPANIRTEMANKYHAGCASGILNSPDENSTPESDPYIEMKYDAETHVKAKQVNKIAFQSRTGLRVDQNAPLFFWPSRLDPMQKGCSLLTDILYQVVHKYWDQGLQIAVVANGSYQPIFRNIVAQHDFYDRVLVCDFDEGLSHLAFAASDFILMPSLFEPCGLPQMTSQYFGSLPVVHDTGGLHDTVERMNVEQHTGNGFPFETYDDGGLMWAMDEAMRFWALPAEVKEREISRVMRESKLRFNHDVTAQEYIRIYENMLARPLVQH
ncbi:glycogen synthase [uncultured Victivallis sp.]|mgnify:FL=1|uniref:glycogen synthase n=1 Tax=uncultured Victivallis sp. TaxID=354118 RepID=UPI0025CF8A65|nr:glycogen/starch synthase [uncultured Victivallis sp.]